MSGIQLSGMEASDMLDVIHYIFEEDTTQESEQALKSQSETRDLLYSVMYERPYKYKYTASAPASDERKYIDDPEDEIDDVADIEPFNPRKNQPKGYLPPTDFDPASPMPFGKGLDAPMG
jgi:hypothetical protein